MEKKLAVIFPGIGYTCAKPLLYYTAASAGDLGYEVIRLDYGQDIHNYKGRGANDLDSIAELALGRVTSVISGIDFLSYKRVVFISKSIGTVIACKVQELFCENIELKQFLLTPIPASLPYLPHINGLFFSGTADPYISSSLVVSAAKDYPDKVGKIYPGCNHSLEQKGNTLKNIQTISEIVSILQSFL